MIVVLSPSKSMDMTPAHITDHSDSDFLEYSEKLVSKARRFTSAELIEFMEISEKLAALNRKRFKDWTPPFDLTNAKQAVFAFTGDVYDGLDANTLKKHDITFAQHHIRILSGLYGLLKPLDLIQPYRLEMGRPLKTRGAKNLYEFWKNHVTDSLNDMRGDVLINLASNEYFKAIDKRNLNKQIISPIFKDEKNGAYKIISFFAKKARGSMARYIVENRITDSDELLRFNCDGYQYNPEFSSPNTPTFCRAQS